MRAKTSGREIVSRVRISEVWTALGGDSPKRGRARAFWRNGDGLNVSLDDAKGAWYDFRDSVGGGVLDLIQHVRGGTRQDALRWLADFLGVPLDDHQMTPAERKEWARKRKAAEAEAQRLVWWKQDLLEMLRKQRGFLLEIYHSATRFLLTHSVDECEARGDVRWELAFDLAWEYWKRIERLDKQIDLLKTAPYSVLLPIYQQQQAAERSK